MQVYISVDMEGVAGVVHVDQTRRTGSDYNLARALMTREANAAAMGAFEGGADEVLVNDSHGDMRNLLLDKLDPRVQVISGSLKPWSMVEGLFAGRFEVALFIGYHAGAGTRAGVLDHTYWGTVVSEVRVNDRVLSETGLNAFVAGAAGTPVGMVSGDDACCQQAQELLGDVLVVPVKWAIGRYAARSLHPEQARKRIREGARRVVRDKPRLKPFLIDPPYRLEVRMHNAGMCDAACLMPGTERVDGTAVSFLAPDVETTFRAMRALLLLGGTGRA